MTAKSKTESKTNLLVRYPLASFFVLSYLLFVITIVIIGAIVTTADIPDGLMNGLIAFSAWTPNLAAIIVTGAVGGREGIRALFAGWLKWRVKFWWYLFGLAPIAMALGSAGLFSLFGGAAPGAETRLTIAALVSMIFFHAIQGATGEELGWRGFALPRLQKRFSPLVSALILGLVVSVWHGLLHLVSPAGIPEWQFWLLMVSYTVMVTWAYNKSRGSVLIATILHFAFNFSLELVSTGLGLVPLESLFAIRTAIYTALAVILILVTGKSLSKERTPL